ncbi:hypothetical protein JHK85_009852 [Glycine max]|nr:hypothetical protein JHK85_009852 [Glycine max]
MEYYEEEFDDEDDVGGRKMRRDGYDGYGYTGGKSSLSAPMGSVRMPAALCGVVGLKPTFERIPHEGVLPLNWNVGMVGIQAVNKDRHLKHVLDRKLWTISIST